MICFIEFTTAVSTQVSYTQVSPDFFFKATYSLCSGSQLGVTMPSWKQSIMSADIFGSHD